jgi:hypothetical protein
MSYYFELLHFYYNFLDANTNYEIPNRRRIFMIMYINYSLNQPIINRTVEMAVHLSFIKTYDNILKSCLEKFTEMIPCSSLVSNCCLSYYKLFIYPVTGNLTL